MMSLLASNRNKRAVSVLNELMLQDPTQSFGPDNVPIGMRESQNSPDSANFGTDRDGEVGRCIVGDQNSWVDCGQLSVLTNVSIEVTFIYRDAITFHSIFGYNFHRDGDTYHGLYLLGNAVGDVSVYSAIGQYTIGTYSDGELVTIKLEYYNNNLYIYSNGALVSQRSGYIDFDNADSRTTIGRWWIDNGTSNASYPSVVEILEASIRELNTNGDHVQTLAHYKLDSLSETTIYDSSGNGNHGTIVNYYEGFWGEQNIKSWQNDVGYSEMPYKFADLTDSNILQGYVGDFLYRSLDTTTIGEEGVVSGLYSDNIGQYMYCVDALRFELSGFDSFPTNSKLRFRWYMPYATPTISFQEGTTAESLYGIMQSFCTDKGIGFTATAINDYYLTATSEDKDYLDAVYTERDVIGGWVEYHDNLPDSWLLNPASAFKPQYFVDVVGYSTDYQEIDIPSTPKSTSGYSSFIRILSPLGAITDGSITNSIDESKLYEFIMLLNGEFTNIPRDESNTTKDILGNSLQYKGLVPSQAKFVESNCFNSLDSAYFSLPNQITLANTDTFKIEFVSELNANGNDNAGFNTFLGQIDVNFYEISYRQDINRLQFVTGGGLADVYSDLVLETDTEYRFVLNKESDSPTLTVSDEKTKEIIVNNMPPTRPSTQPYSVLFDTIGLRGGGTPVGGNSGNMYDLTITKNGTLIHRYPLSEYITDPSNHTAFDVVGDNHATLIDGSTDNRGLQDEFFWDQLGYYNNGTQDIPIKADLSAFADGTPLSSGLQQDGKSFLNTGTKLQHQSIPRVLAGTTYWGTAKTWDELINSLDQVFVDTDGDSKANIRTHKQPLSGRQLVTEKIITNN